jgi:hypothetical protein
MHALLLALALAQSTAGIRITVRVVKPRCVVIDAAGEARAVPRRDLGPEARVLGCAPSTDAGAPRVEQKVEAPRTAEAPELRLVEVTY